MEIKKDLYKKFESKLLLFQRSIRHHEVRWQKISKMSLLETMLLRFIILEGPHKMKDVSNKFEIKLSTLTSVIDKLERNNLLLRKHTPHDRRVILLHPSVKGKKRFEEYRNFLWQSLNQLATNFEEQQLSHFVEAIQSLHLSIAANFENQTIDTDS
ncbi:MAG: MarR family winged helix-turn-helix transcriptional regulator [Bacteroidia bacterium]